jgi:hypothetical protein
LFWFTILAQHETNDVILYIHGAHKHRGNTFQRQNYKMRRSNSGSAHFHVSWLSDFIFYPKPLYKSLHQSFFYSFITTLHSKSGVTCTLNYSTGTGACVKTKICSLMIKPENDRKAEDVTWPTFPFAATEVTIVNKIGGLSVSMGHWGCRW